MKIRTGFVSNSSSSSFCVLGAYLPAEKLQPLLKELVENKISLYTYSDGVSAVTNMEIWDDCDIEKEAKGYGGYSYSKNDTILTGFDVDGHKMSSILDKKDILLKVLGCTEDDLRITGWGYYSG